VEIARLGLNRIRKKGIGSKQREDKATGKAAGKMDQLELGRRVENLQQEVARTVGTAVGCRAGTEQRQRRKTKGISQGLICNFRKLQGPLGKNKFNHCSRAQT
jgi:hypothetical protein